jgi:hypothetical protein
MNFEAKVKYEKIDPLTGKNKVVSETYLLDAETFGDAEEKTIKYMADITNAQVISTVKKSDVEDIIGDTESDMFYKSTIKQSIIDELSGKESVNNIKVLTGCDNLKGALTFTEYWQNESMFDCETTNITKSPIVGIF